MSNKPNGGTIEHWSILNIKGVGVVNGVIFGDPREFFSDGDYIRTSRVVELDEKKSYLETTNTIYVLGSKR